MVGWWVLRDAEEERRVKRGAKLFGGGGSGDGDMDGSISGSGKEDESGRGSVEMGEAE